MSRIREGNRTAIYAERYARSSALSRNRSRKQKALAIRSMRRGVIVMALVVTVLFVLLAIEGFRMRQELLEGDAVHMELVEEIAAEKARSKTVDEQKAYLESESFIRQTAREKLGLVSGDEIIFKARDNG